MKLVSAPLIARLNLRTRKWAHEAITRGRFGAVTRHRGVLFVALAEVERAIGVTIDAAQIERAGEGMPDRILTVSPTE